MPVMSCLTCRLLEHSDCQRSGQSRTHVHGRASRLLPSVPGRAD